MEIYAPDDERTERLLKRLADWKRNNPNSETYRSERNKEFYFGDEVNEYKNK